MTNWNIAAWWIIKLFISSEWTIVQFPPTTFFSLRKRAIPPFKVESDLERYKWEMIFEKGKWEMFHIRRDHEKVKLLK